jgi:hypothetical protein
MLTLMIFATLLIPFYYMFKFTQRNNIDIVSIIGFKNDNSENIYLDMLNENNIDLFKEKYDKILIKINYREARYKIMCLTRHLNLPLQITNQKQSSHISKAEVVCENNTYDVTEIVKKYSGPNDDFFGNPFNMCWIFPEYKENNKQALLRLYTENKVQHTIDLLTNEEIVDDDSEDVIQQKRNGGECDFILYDSDIDSFILEDSE